MLCTQSAELKTEYHSITTCCCRYIWTSTSWCYINKHNQYNSHYWDKSIIYMKADNTKFSENASTSSATWYYMLLTQLLQVAYKLDWGPQFTKTYKSLIVIGYRALGSIWTSPTPNCTNWSYNYSYGSHLNMKDLLDPNFHLGTCNSWS